MNDLKRLLTRLNIGRSNGMSTERLEKWANKATKEQLEELAVVMVQRMMEIEEVRFHSDSLAPFWESCGEPLIEGQQISSDD